MLDKLIASILIHCHHWFINVFLQPARRRLELLIGASWFFPSNANMSSTDHESESFRARAGNLSALRLRASASTRLVSSAKTTGAKQSAAGTTKPQTSGRKGTMRFRRTHAGTCSLAGAAETRPATAMKSTDARDVSCSANIYGHFSYDEKSTVLFFCLVIRSLLHASCVIFFQSQQGCCCCCCCCFTVITNDFAPVACTSRRSAAAAWIPVH